MLKKIKRFLIVWDGIWSVPFAFLMFVGFNYFIEWMWPGAHFTGMSPEYVHKLVYAALIMVGMNVASWLAIFFNFHKVWDYYLGDSGKNFKDLKPFTKICIVIFLYFAFYFSGILLVLIPV